MGTLYSKINNPIKSLLNRKRKYDDGSELKTDVLQNYLIPKRKKLNTTSEYIYQTLFKKQENWDVVIKAMENIWRLHKVYLCQSPYFETMFNGSWRESQDEFIIIKIEDQQINLEALDAVFGSLYMDEIIIDPKNIISILATATLFQLDCLIERCAEIMIDTLNAITAVDYFEAACRYGLQSVKESAFKWMLINLLSFYSNHTQFLRNINPDLMERLISDPDLYVLQTEFSAYILLKTWLFLQTNTEYSDEEDITLEISNFFSKFKDMDPFLLQNRGKSFKNAFKNLRLNHIVNHPVDFQTIIADNIIPRIWIFQPIISQWYSLLRIDQCLDKGPEEIDVDYFSRNCVRCGRILQSNGFEKWRWTGFNFGIDLILIANNGALSLKRHHRAENSRLLSLQAKRSIQMRINICSLNKQRQAVHTQKTDIRIISLDKNEEFPILQMNKELEYPLLISFNFLIISRNDLTECLKNMEPVDNNYKFFDTNITASNNIRLTRSNSFRL